jgi:phage tail protein X
MSTYITKMFDRLDRIVYARYGTTDNQIVEWVFEQNPGLELYGILLPQAITINLPDAPKKLSSPPVLPTIFLWK